MIVRVCAHRLDCARFRHQTTIPSRREADQPDVTPRISFFIRDAELDPHT